ncbi:MAG TPA: xanthine dehydrogenase family protein subunit M [Chloroflexota bacterium]|nr:xanthine dehydrogenase family protein subunit M [Chloroflexota bacterium]
MIPPAFAYSRPSSIEEAIEILAGDPEAKVLAGGHSLIPLLKLRLAQPSQLVDVNRIPGLSYIREEDGHIALGALTTHYQAESSELLRRSLPLLVETVGHVGDVQVRNRGTIGGSLAHVDPSADLGATALALNAVMVAQGRSGRREIPAGEFFVDLLTSALEPDELLVEIRFPRPPTPAAWRYVKFNKRAIDWAIVGVAVQLALDGNRIQDVGIGLTGVGGTPLRAVAVESALRGQTWSAELARSASEHASEGLDPPADHNASAEYRLHLTRVLTRRALEAAAESV